MELLRLWDIDGAAVAAFHVPWDNPAHWGLFLADVARIITKGLVDIHGLDKTTSITELRKAFDQGLDGPSPTVTGETVDHYGRPIR